MADQGKNPVVMIVDDDCETLDMLGNFFSMKGYRPVPVEDPTTVMRDIPQEKPDIILLEIIMEKLRGDSLLKVMRSRGIKVPVIVVSGHISKTLIIELIKYQVKGFFAKPVALEKLEEKVESLIASKGREGEIKKIASSVSDVGGKYGSILAISEDGNDRLVEIAQDFAKKRGLKIVSESSTQQVIRTAKKSSSNVRMILVYAANETQTLTLAKLLNISLKSMNIPVIFLAEEFSSSLMNGLKNMGFATFINLESTSQEDIQKTFDSLLLTSSERDGISKSERARHIFYDLRKIKSLPPLPDIFVKVEELSQNREASSADYGKILELDPGITARLLRIANSALFSFRRSIDSVSDAVALMGTSEIVSMVRLSGIISLLFDGGQDISYCFEYLIIGDG